MGCCSHPAAFPQRAPEVLWFVSESVQAALAFLQPTWLKGHHVSSAKGGRVTAPHLFAKQAHAFPLSLQQDTFHEALFRAQPPRSGSLEASATQVQRRNYKAEVPRNAFGDQQAAGTSGHAPVYFPSPPCKHLGCTRQMCRVRTSPSLSCLVLPCSHNER